MYCAGQSRFCARNSSVDGLGAGVGLHFRLLWYYFVFFTLALAIALIVLVLNASGNRLTTEELDPLRLSRLSIANVGDRFNFANYTVIVPVTKQHFSARAVSNIIMATDFIYVVLFIVMIVFLYGRIKSITERIETNAVSARDYTIFVTNLPENVTEDTLKKHFDRLYNLRNPDWKYMSSIAECFCNRKSRQRRQYADKGAPPRHWQLPINSDDQAISNDPNVSNANQYTLRTIANPAVGQPGKPALFRNMRALQDDDVYPVQGSCQLSLILTLNRIIQQPSNVCRPQRRIPWLLGG
jgi:preprotein translocase subunit SecG